MKGTLSLVSPSARPKNRRKTAAYGAYDFVESYAIDPKKDAKWDQIGTRMALAKRTFWRTSSDSLEGLHTALTSDLGLIADQRGNEPIAVPES